MITRESLETKARALLAEIYREVDSEDVRDVATFALDAAKEALNEPESCYCACHKGDELCVRCQTLAHLRAEREKR